MIERAKNVSAFGQRPGNLKSSLTSSFGYLDFEDIPSDRGIGDGLFEGDLKFFFENVNQHSVPVDIRMVEGLRDAEQDLTFETSVIISLFTDRRAGVDDILPDESGYRGGWAGDQILNDLYEQDLVLGSRLWLLSRSKINNDLFVQMQDYCREALQWMITFNIAERIEVDVTQVDMEHVNFEISIFRPGEDNISYRYLFNWIAQTFTRN